MSSKKIETDADYKEALWLVDKLCDAQSGTTDFETLINTVTSIEAYEAETFPIGPPDQAAVVQYETEKRGLSHIG